MEVSAADNARLYGYFRRVLGDFNLRVEERHLRRGCLSFMFVMSDNDHDILQVHSGKLKDAHSKLPEGEILQLEHRRSDNGKAMLLHYTANGTELISAHRSVCETFSSSSVSLLGEKVRIPAIIAEAHAQSEISDIDHLLVTSLSSENSLVRDEAIRLLLARPPSVISLMISEMRRVGSTSEEWERLAEGSVVAIGRMLAMGIPAEVVRTELGDSENFGLFVDMLSHEDDYVRNVAIAGLLRLDDTSTYQFLTNALDDSLVSAKGKKYAALALAGIFPNLSEEQQSSVVGSSYNVDWIAGEILSGLTAHHIDNDESIFLPSPYREGWTYIGTFFGDEWADVMFELPREGEVLQVGDEIVANWSRSLREDAIEYDRDNMEWTDADVVGLLKQGSRVRVSEVKEVLGAYYWAKIEALNGNY